MNIGSRQDIDLAGIYGLKDCFQVSTKSLYFYKGPLSYVQIYLHMYVLGMHSVNIVTFSPLGCMLFSCPHFHFSCWRRARNWSWNRLSPPQPLWLMWQKSCLSSTTIASCRASSTLWPTPPGRNTDCCGERPSSALV